MKSIVGVDLGTTHVRVAQTTRPDKAGRVTVTAAAVQPLPEGALAEGRIVNAPAIIEALKLAVAEAKVKRAPAVVGLVAPESVVAHRDIPAAAQKHEWADQIRFDPNPLSPTLRLDDARLSVQPDGAHHDDVIPVAVAAAPTIDVDEYANILDKAGIACRAVDLSAAAIMRATTRFDSDPADEVIVDIGATKTLVLAIIGGQLVDVRTLPVGGKTFTDAIAQAMSVEDGEDHRDEAEEAKRFLRVPPRQVAAAYGSYIEDDNPETTRQARIEEALWDASFSLVEQIVQIIDTADQRAGRHAQQVILTGRGAMMRGFAPLLASNLDRPVGFSPGYADLPDKVAANLTTHNDDPVPYLTEAVGLAMWEPTR